MQRAALLRPLVGSPLVSAGPLAQVAVRRRCRFHGGVRVRSSTGEGGSEPGGGEGAGAAASWLSSAVGEKVDEILRREENRALLEGVEDAERRVERARCARRHRAPGGRRAPRPRGSSPPREAAR